MHVVLFCLCFLAFSFFYCTVISIFRKGLAFRLPGEVVSYPSMLCPRGRAFRGCPTSGSSTFSLMFFFWSRFLRPFFFFQSPCKRPKISHHSVHPGSTIVEGCNWEGVAPGPAAPVPSPEAISKLAVKASVRDLRFGNPVCFRAGNIHNFITRWEEVLTGQEKRAEILSYLRDGVDVNPFFAPYGRLPGQVLQ